MKTDKTGNKVKAMSTQPTALAQLRHLYQNMLNGGVRDTASAKRIAEGLLGPAIEALERGTPATGGEPVAWIRFQPPYRPDVLVQRHRPTLDGEPDTQYRPLAYLCTSPQPVRKPMPEDVAKLVQAAQAFVLEPNSLKKKIELEARAWGPLADTPQPVREPLTDKRLKVKLGSWYGRDLAGHWFYLHPSDEYAEAALAEREHGITGGQT